MGWKAAQKLIQNWKILRGDNVMIIRGKDQGETGLIKRVVRSQNRVIVEGNNPVSPFPLYLFHPFVIRLFSDYSF
ncbi:hypothetical protein AAC387_Pa09g2282 [Persea americana]